MTSFRLRGSRRGVRRAIHLALAAALATAAGASSASATPLGTNLIFNGDAEVGRGASVLSTDIFAPTGWTTTANFTAALYATAPNLDLGDSTLIGGGNNYFAGGPQNSIATATQHISFDDLASDVDAGKLNFLLTGYLGGWGNQDDTMAVRATFLDAANGMLLASLLAPVSSANRLNDTQLLFVTSGLTSVPVGARSVNIAMTSTRLEGSYNDGYADNLSLLFQALDTPSQEPSGPDVPEPASLSLLGLGLVGLIARRLKR